MTQKHMLAGASGVSRISPNLTNPTSVVLKTAQHGGDLIMITVTPGFPSDDFYFPDNRCANLVIDADQFLILVRVIQTKNLLVTFDCDDAHPPADGYPISPSPTFDPPLVPRIEARLERIGTQIEVLTQTAQRIEQLLEHRLPHVASHMNGDLKHPDHGKRDERGATEREGRGG